MSGTRRRNTVLEVLEVFRSLDGTGRISTVLAFLYVCENEGLSVSELALACGFNKATASRSIRSLASKGTRGALPPALGLVSLTQEGRIRSLRLTPQGQALRDRIDAVIARAVPIRSVN